MIPHDADFTEAAKEVTELNGISFEIALDYLWQIGDTPETVEDGTLTIVRDNDGREIARIRIPENRD